MRNGTCSRGEFPQPRAVRASRLARVSALAAKIAHVARHRFPLAIIRHAVWVYGGRARSLAACSAAELHQQPGPEPAAQQAFGSHQSPLYLEAKDWGCPSANHRVSDERRECANTGRSPTAWRTGRIDPLLTLPTSLERAEKPTKLPYADRDRGARWVIRAQIPRGYQQVRSYLPSPSGQPLPARRSSALWPATLTT